MVNYLLADIEDLNERKALIPVFEGIIARIGLRKTLHFLYEAEKNPHKSSYKYAFIRKVINEELLENEEAFQLKGYPSFGQSEFFEDMNLKKSLIRLTENPKIIKGYFESNLDQSRTTSNHFPASEKKEELVSIKSKCWGNDLSEKISESQFSGANLSPGRSEKNGDFEVSTPMKINQQEERKEELFMEGFR